MRTLTLDEVARAGRASEGGFEVVGAAEEEGGSAAEAGGPVVDSGLAAGLAAQADGCGEVPGLVGILPVGGAGAGQAEAGGQPDFVPVRHDSPI
ncbi:hypothetical protein [Microlunatus sp. GCM10028923]|uniref:hypothetical protein n=1 Tax=Microlunatus sp. GCM10028923 TaxID=3273400 RepID=UPI00361735B4